MSGFDPEIKSYFKIPFSNQALPSLSLWEYNKARETMKQMGDSKADEHRVLRAITELRSIVAQSEEKTKKPDVRLNAAVNTKETFLQPSHFPLQHLWLRPYRHQCQKPVQI